MIMISKDVIGIYAGCLRSYARGGRIAAGGGLFAGGPFAAGLIADGLSASGLNAAPRYFVLDKFVSYSRRQHTSFIHNFKLELYSFCEPCPYTLILPACNCNADIH